MVTCVISQPRFFPGLHYLHRMMVADVFVILDTVQYTPRHEENRAKLKGTRGPQWLSIPVLQRCREQKICDTRIDHSQPWRRKCIGALRELYGRSRHFRSYADEVFDVFAHDYEVLTDLDCASWELALRLLGVTCRFFRASELPVSGRGQRLLLDICKHVGADVYLSGAFGRDYLDVSEFLAEGIAVRFHTYTYPVYPQRFGDFVPFVSYLDALFNADLQPDAIRAGGQLLAPDQVPLRK